MPEGTVKTKPGIKTTEFWLTILANIVGLAMEVLGAVEEVAPENQWVRISLVLGGLGLQALSGFGYVASRTALKKAEAIVKAKVAA